MINGDIENFYQEGNEIAKKIRDGDNYFDTGGEYRRPYLPSRIFAFFSLLTSKELTMKTTKLVKILIKSIY